MGVSDIAPCRPYDFLCQVARRAAKGAVYSEWAQENLVQVRRVLIVHSHWVHRDEAVIGTIFPGSCQTGYIYVG
jgi:hypothetical protein